MEKSKLVESFEKHIGLLKAGTSFAAVPEIIKLFKGATTDEREQIREILKNERRVLRFLCVVNSPQVHFLYSLLDSSNTNDQAVIDFLFVETEDLPADIIDKISGNTAEQQQKLLRIIDDGRHVYHTIYKMTAIKKVGIDNIDKLIQLATIGDRGGPYNEAKERILELIKLYSQTDLKEYVTKELEKYQGEKKNEIFEFIEQIKKI